MNDMLLKELKKIGRVLSTGKLPLRQWLYSWQCEDGAHLDDTERYRKSS